MISLRRLSWPHDRMPLLALDTSFKTDRIFRLEHAEGRSELVEVAVAPPIEKAYSLAADIDAMPSYDTVHIAEVEGRVVGMAAMRMRGWNRRAEIEHLYVAPEMRGMGVGRALLAATSEVGRVGGARCVWAETQTINYGAIGFYRKEGFRWCGFDTSLYDPATVGADEVAIFFTREL